MDERLTPEEIELIIRQHNAARVKPSRTELALLGAQLAKANLDRPELEEELKTKIVTLAVGIMIIVGKLKPEDLEEEDKDRFETICEAIKNQILSLLNPEAIRREVAEEIFGELDQWNGTITKDTPSEAFPNMVTTKSLRVLTNRLKSRLGGRE